MGKDDSDVYYINIASKSLTNYLVFFNIQSQDIAFRKPMPQLLQQLQSLIKWIKHLFHFLSIHLFAVKYNVEELHNYHYNSLSHSN